MPLIKTPSRPGHGSARTGQAISFRLMLLLAFCFVLCGLRSVAAQAYTSVVVFGDSLSDTGNDAVLSRAKYTFSLQVPGPLTGYTNGRFTDGLDTSPAARNYTGVWIEQLAAKFATHPAVLNSLAGGANYSYGFATTGNGTSVFTYGPNDVLSFTLNNMGQQLTDYLATRPAITSNTLFVVWGGANDLLHATSSADVLTAATQEVTLVQRLVAAGATDILVPNLPPLGLVPRLNGSQATSVPATAAVQAFNQALAAGLAQAAAASSGRTLRLYPLDVYTLFSTAVASPAGYGFANVTASSQGNTTVNPDTYLFWDDLHPTTYGHSLIAAAALNLLGTPVSTTVSLTTSADAVNLGGSVTLTAAVTAANGTPTGTVTFRDGTTVLGTGLVTGTGATARATLTTTTLAAGSHSVTATFTGANGYSGSTSTAATITVVAPAFAAAVAPSSLTLARGNAGVATVTITPSGGYTGSFNLACGAIANVSCSIGSSSLSITGTSAVSTSVTVGTTNVSANKAPAGMGKAATRVACAFALLCLLSCVSFRNSRRRMLRFASLMALPVLLSLGMLLGVSGCASDPLARDTHPGTYQVPIIVTPTSGTPVILTVGVTVQ
jgi:phospholipase/lecithinase/hemolysin